MGVDDLHSGAAHHSDFVHHHGNLTTYKTEEGAFLKFGFLAMVFVTTFLLGMTLIRLAKREQVEQEHKDR